MGRELTFDIDEAIRLFKETASWRKVAVALSTSENVVHPYSIQSALEPLGYVTVKTRGNFRKWDVEEAARLRAKKPPVPFKTIAEKMGVSESAIKQGLAQFRKKVPQRFKKK